MNNEDCFEAESQVGGTQRHPIETLNLEDAISYLRQVRSKFGNDHYVYYHFIDILKELQSGSIDFPQFVQSFSNLFRDHPDLIVRFNNYLPPKYRIEVQLNQQVQVSLPGTNLGGSATVHSTHGSQCSHSPSPRSSTGNAVNNVCGSKDDGLESDFQALSLENRNPLESQVGGMKKQLMLNYLRLVKSKFGSDHYEYYDFLDILEEYHSRSIDFPEFIQSISSLFQDHPDLIVGFNNFLPPENRIEVQLNQQVQVSLPGTNLGAGATSAATSLTIHPGGSPTATVHSTHGSQCSHSPSPRFSTGNAGKKE